MSLKFNFENVSTKTPLILKKDYAGEIKKVEAKENKDKTGKNLVVMIELKGPFTSQQGAEQGLENDVTGNINLFSYLPLQQKDESSPDYRRGLCLLWDAAMGTNDETRGEMDFEEILNRKVIVTVNHSKETPEFPSNNQIARFSHLA